MGLKTRIQGPRMKAQKPVTTELVHIALAFDDSEVSGVVGLGDGIGVKFSAAPVTLAR